MHRMHYLNKYLFLLLFCFAAENIVNAQINLNQGLIAYYPFNGNANDISGNAINGNVSSASSTTDSKGINNAAYDFNGTNSYISLPYNSLYDFAPTDSFSISAWVQPQVNLLYAASAIVVKSPFNASYLVSNWNYGLYTVNDKAMTGWAANNFLNGVTTMDVNKCWYHLVVTYKNGIWYLYVNGKVEAQDLSQTHFIIQDGTNSTIALGRKGESNGDYYKGKMDEVRIYNRNLNIDEVKALFYLDATLPEFSFAQNICNPKQMSFKNETANYIKFYWNFSNGTVDSSNIQPSITYSNYGSYNVQLITSNGLGCLDTTVKNIAVNVATDTNLIITKDTTICSGSNFIIKARDTGIGYCWTPVMGLTNANTATPTASPSNTTTYYYTTKVLGSNLVVNGDFENGNVGFTSSYIEQPPPNTIEEVFFIGTNAKTWNSSVSPCHDHTSGVGKMMLINGSPQLNVEIWKESIIVQPNTNYAFSAWLQSIYPINPAQLKFSINGVQVGQLLQASSSTCLWKQFYVTWNSGSNTIAKISIVNQNTQIQGNDFAIDDISFASINIKTDSVRVSVQNCPANPCSSWLKTPTTVSYIECGDLDITGDKLTIEATFNNPSSINTANFHGGKIVSKHTNQTNCNYSLMDYTAEITTQNSGYVITPPVCIPDLNKTYHVAMVYDGSLLKFYRDGILMSQIAASGNLIQNNLLTAISQGSAASAGALSQYFGLVNEVRIWKVARTQQQLQQYMDDTLPNPTTQTGLLAYYTFNSLKNKQGNTAFDGVLIGSASINEANPNCSLNIDSCGVMPTSPVINPNCKGTFVMDGGNKISLPPPYSQYYNSTGFTWETWFNSSYYDNNNNSIGTRNKLLSALDIIPAEDILIGFGWAVGARKKELCFVVDGDGGILNRDNTPCTYIPPGGFVPATWYHVAGVRDYANNKSCLYVNGQLVDTKNNTHTPITRSMTTFMGNFLPFVDSGFAGKMDEVRIWNYPRSSSQILNNYDKCINRTETGLVAYYHSNEGKGLTLKDVSPNNNNATLGSTVTWDKSDNAPIGNICYQSTTSSVNKTICFGQTFQNHSTTGVYIDTITNSQGCDSIMTLSLVVLQPSVITNDTISGCGSVVFNGNAYTSNSLVSDTIKNSNGCDSIIHQHLISLTNKKHTLSVSICSGQSFAGYNITGVYTDTFHLAGGCDSMRTLMLNVVTFIPDAISVKICKGSSYQGHSTAGIYYDTIPSTVTCDTLRTITLTVLNSLPRLQNDTSICDGDFVTLSPGKFSTYLWNTGAITPSIQINGQGQYWVIVKDSLGCSNSDTFNLLAVYSKPFNFLPVQISVCEGENFSLYNYQSYLWNTGETMPAISLQGLNSYWVKVTNSNNCAGSDTMKVLYNGTEIENNVNAFSPNGDDKNELFKPLNGSCITSFSMVIYNRWGQLIHQSIDANKGWDGKQNGILMPQGVYYYILNYTNAAGVQKRKTGSLTLLR